MCGSPRSRVAKAPGLGMFRSPRGRCAEDPRSRDVQKLQMWGVQKSPDDRMHTLRGHLPSDVTGQEAEMTNK